MTTASDDTVVVHTGGCHCGAVRFRIRAPRMVAVVECNCSVCRMTGYLHLFVERDAFELVSGDDALTCYSFNTRAAQHLFCRHCGIKSFYVPRSHPDAYSVNIRCLDPGTLRAYTVSDFDGRNWESAIDTLA